MVPIYWLLIVGLVVLFAGVAIGILWKSRNTRGEHSYYHPALSVSALAIRISRESMKEGQ